MSVSLVKNTGRHAAENMVEQSPVVYVTPWGGVVRQTAGVREIVADSPALAAWVTITA